MRATWMGKPKAERAGENESTHIAVGPACSRKLSELTPLPWLISVPAMIDESNIPRFKQRLEIRYDHRPALRDGSDELGVRPFNRMGECELRGRPRGLNLVDATGVALCLELGLPFI